MNSRFDHVSSTTSTEKMKEVEKRFKIFAKYFVEEFEDQLEAYDIYLKGNKPEIIDMVIKSFEKLTFDSNTAAVKELGKGAIKSVRHQKDINIAGKMVELVQIYKTPEQKQKLREIMIEAAFELFKSFEYQFLNVEKKHGGFDRALLQIARAAVWCFFRYYNQNPQEINVQFVLEGITLKLRSDINWLKKFLNSTKKNFSDVHVQDSKELKWDPIDLFSQVGVMVGTAHMQKYYVNDFTKHETFGFRLQFPFEENNLNVYKELTEKTAETADNQVKYCYELQKYNKTELCKDLLESFKKITDMTQKELKQNLDEIVKNIIERLLYEYFFEIREMMFCSTSSQSDSEKASTSSNSATNTAPKNQLNQNQSNIRNMKVTFN